MSIINWVLDSVGPEVSLDVRLDVGLLVRSDVGVGVGNAAALDVRLGGEIHLVLMLVWAFVVSFLGIKV